MLDSRLRGNVIPNRLLNCLSCSAQIILNGTVTASGFVESAVNQVISKRFVKRQQMAWQLQRTATDPYGRAQ